MLIMTFMAVLAGMALSMQAAINGQLGARVGVVHSAFLTFSVGTVVTALLIFFFAPPASQHLLNVPKWQLIGALFGIVYMLVMVAAIPRVGVAIATVATLLGQMSMSLVIDTLGWLGNTALPLNHWRIGAMLALTGALVCIYRANQLQDISHE
ncbi:MAG: DMT family transporter [Aeromonas sp.]